MKRCPYCGRENDDGNVNCEKCFARIPIPAEKPKEQPKKAEKKTDKE